MLIKNAEIYRVGHGDVRIANGRVAAIGDLSPRSDEHTIDARGGALLPGLHDHHIHLAACAVKASSIPCGPPDVCNPEALRQALERSQGTSWIRGIGYHESVLGGLPDRFRLDRLVPDRPLRIQHQSGRMWFLNSAALDALSHVAPPAGLLREHGRFTGQLFDEDHWLQQALASTPPDLAGVSSELARFGVTGVTDMSPRNNPLMAEHFFDQRHNGCLAQKIVVAGALSLEGSATNAWALGPAKLHLHEADLPDFDDAVAFSREAHSHGRRVAVHCVSEVELVFALAVLEEAGDCAGDRIEHVSVASHALLDRMAALKLHACVQPHFIYERGDRYLADVEPQYQPDLYRLDSLAKRGISMAGGSDAPYGTLNPWTAIAAAVSRRTSTGKPISADEALSYEAALSLYLSDPLDFTRQRTIHIGAEADLCLLHGPWQNRRDELASGRIDGDVAATIISGKLVYDRVDQTPL